VYQYTTYTLDNECEGLGESVVPPCTRGSVSLARGPGRKPGPSLYTRKRLSLSLSHTLSHTLDNECSALVVGAAPARHKQRIHAAYVSVVHTRAGAELNLLLVPFAAGPASSCFNLHMVAFHSFN